MCKKNAFSSRKTPVIMQYRTSFSFGNNRNPFNSVFSILVFVGVLLLLYFAITGFVKLLYFVAPFLLVATLMINHRVVMDYVVDIADTFRSDILWGVLKVFFTILGYPFVIGWLFAKAMLFRRVQRIHKEMEQQMRQGGSAQFADYEEVSSDIVDSKPVDIPFIELPKSDENQDKTKP